jgi:hypothetical protein
VKRKLAHIYNQPRNNDISTYVGLKVGEVGLYPGEVAPRGDVGEPAKLGEVGE